MVQSSSGTLLILVRPASNQILRTALVSLALVEVLNPKVVMNHARRALRAMDQVRTLVSHVKEEVIHLVVPSVTRVPQAMSLVVAPLAFPVMQVTLLMKLRVMPADLVRFHLSELCNVRVVQSARILAQVLPVNLALRALQTEHHVLPQVLLA